MKNFLFFFLLLFILNEQVNAQTSPIITGPREVCRGCETYTLQGIGQNQGYLENLYVVNNQDPKDTLCAQLYYIQEQQNMQVCFNCPGQYTLYAFAYMPNGEIRQDSFQVFVYEFPRAVIVPQDSLACQSTASQGDCQKVCPGYEETYYLAESSGSAFFTDWTVNGADNFTINGNSVTVKWGSSGYGYINAFVSGEGQFCFSEDSYCVEIVNELEANFTLPGNQFCANEIFSPTPDNLKGSRYEWDFGNGETSKDIIPDIRYETPGTYVITLKIYNECGCFGTFSKEVIIKDLFLPTIDCQSTICENTRMTYTTTADCGKLYWKILGNGTNIEGGGITDRFITVEWSNGPVGYIELEVADCNFDKCPKKAVFEIPIVSDLANITGPAVACRNEVSMYTIQKYAATQYNWTVQGGTITAGQGGHTILVEWAGGSTGSVEVNYENCYLQCGGSASYAVNLTDPYFIVPGAKEVCMGDVFTAQSYTTSFQPISVDKWRIIDPSGSVLKEITNTAQAQFNVPSGIEFFTVIALSNSLCSGEQSEKIRVLSRTQAPDGIEGEFAICKNNAYNYKAVSNLSKADFQWTIWDGGGKTTYHGPTLSYEWTSDGPYKIELQQTDLTQQLCISNSYVQAVEKIDQINLFGDPSSCVYDKYEINATLFTGLRYQWSVASSDAGTFLENDSSNVSILWSKPGLHTISLSTCAGVFSKQIEVHGLPQPVVDHATTACEGSFTSVKVLPGYAEAIWKNTDKIQVASGNDVMIVPGTYTVEVKDNNGCKSLENFTIQSFPKPNVYLSSPDQEGICLSQPGWQYPELVVNTAEGGYQYQWFLNNVDLGVNTPTYLTQSTGTYHLIVTDLHNCTNVSNTLVVYDYCDPNDPGNGGGGNGGNACNTTTGTAAFVSAPLDCNTLEFTSTSTQVINGGYQWNFGDLYSNQNDAIGSVVRHDFTNAGYYNVKHTVEVTDNQTGSSCHLLVLNKVAVELAADFEYGLACEGAEIKFYDRTTHIPGTQIISWEWDFGDPASGVNNAASTAEVTHIFQNEGSYTVKLKVSNGSCFDEIQKTITLHPKPNAVITAQGDVCEKQATPLSLVPEAGIVKAKWNLGDPISGANNEYEGLSPAHQYNTATSYSILVTAETIYGCKASLTGNVLIQPNTLGGSIASSLGVRFCDGLSSLLQSPAGGTAWKWNEGQTTESISVTETGFYNVEITNPYGCQFTSDNMLIEVLPLPESWIKSTILLDEDVKTSFDSNIDFCAGADFSLEVINKNQWTYNWSVGSPNPKLDFTEASNNRLLPGTYSYYVDMKDIITGCENREGPIEIKVNGLPAPPQIAANTPGILCDGTPHLLTVTNPLGNISYKWSTGKKATQIDVSGSSDYFVVGTDANGCSAKSNIISVVKGPDAELVPYGCFERCAPDTLCFPAIAGVASYQWYKNEVGLTSAEGGNTAYPIITMDGSYHLLMSGTNGCLSKSKPLNLTLKSPVGNIIGKVYSDVNANGVIDNVDTLLNGVILTTAGIKDTTMAGIYSLYPIPAGQVSIEVDTLSLPPASKVLTSQLTVNLAGCDDEETLDILIGINCVSQSKTTSYVLCPGEIIQIEGQDIKEDANLTFYKPQSAGCVDTFHYEIDFKAPILASIQTSEACPGGTNGMVNLSSDHDETFKVIIDGKLKGTGSGSWTGFSPGIYSIELIDGNQCVTRYEAVVKEKVKPEFTLTGENLTCIKTETTAQLTLLNYTQDQVTIQWSTSSNGLVTSITQAGPVTVTVDNGCGAEAKTLIIEQEKAKHEVRKFIVCNGNKLELFNQQFSRDTQFYLLKTAANGCNDTTTFDLKFSPDFNVSLDIKGSCPGIGSGSIVLSGNQLDQFRFFLNDQPVIANNYTIPQLYYGNYTLTIKDNNGCQETVPVAIPQKETVVFDLIDEDISCFKGIAEIGVEVSNYEIQDLVFTWSNGGTSPVIETAQTGNYSLSIYNGCETKELSFEVGTTDKLPSFDLPNILAPVGENATIDLQKTPFVNSEIVRFDIFDRMGKLVYKSNPGSTSWQDNFGSYSMASGVYVYFIEANVDICGKIENMKKAGTLTVLR